MILTDRHPPLRKKERITPILKPVVPFPIEALVDPWAEQHGILLIGTHQDANDIYYDGFDESLTVDPTTVNGYELALDGLKQLPDHVIVAMEPQYNHKTQLMETKAVYFSTAPNRGYALIMPKDYSEKCLMGIHSGFILEQKSCDWAKFALHECGHIVDHLGITGEYYWEIIWGNLATERNRIFDAEGELMSKYANANSREDFAEHFAYYVTKSTTFRTKALTNADLQERYSFLKDNIFQGVEYEEPPPPVITELEGEVTDAWGEVVTDALVYSDKGFLVRSNTEGWFRVQNIEEGKYTIWAEKEGYIKSPEIIADVIAGVPVTISLTLTSIPTPPPPPNLWWIPVAVVTSIGVAYLSTKI